MVYSDWEIFVFKNSFDFVVKLVADIGYFKVELFLVLGGIVFGFLDSLSLDDGFHKGGWVVVFQKSSFEVLNVLISIFLSSAEGFYSVYLVGDYVDFAGFGYCRLKIVEEVFLGRFGVEAEDVGAIVVDCDIEVQEAERVPGVGVLYFKFYVVVLVVHEVENLVSFFF